MIAAIVKAYVATGDTDQRTAALERAIGYAVEAINTVRGREVQYRHSEDDLNGWGYTLLQQGKRQEALAVFQLNASLHPESANVFDSLADGLEATGDTLGAVGNYRRALELDPTKKHAAERLKALGVPATH